ncbi:hypothetical protein SSS_08864 [Sarcoptes scabiei]|uniref:Uncharacterized protein n=1 Tax=Sarcoptes scabiei TaxID=52283 RepID=A0A131ZXS7_SARSC|nr:hypothetical protein SSS_08864 [Sarcoptes scabiei]KPM03616.1 hypothetical protein QR98_0020490 [Sarcoptes scabiei]
MDLRQIQKKILQNLERIESLCSEINLIADELSCLMRSFVPTSSSLPSISMDVKLSIDKLTMLMMLMNDSELIMFVKRRLQRTTEKKNEILFLLNESRFYSNQIDLFFRKQYNINALANGKFNPLTNRYQYEREELMELSSKASEIRIANNLSIPKEIHRH